MEKQHISKGRKTIIDSDDQPLKPEENAQTTVISEKEEDLNNKKADQVGKRNVKRQKRSDKDETIGEEKEKKKAAKATKEKPKKLKEEDIEHICLETIEHMKLIYRKDVELNEKNKPAFNKIEKIQDICHKIINKELSEAFVKLGVLNELKTWLEPLPDKTLPSQIIKTSILDLLMNLKVTKYDLINSGIGKIIFFYSKNAKEAVDVRKMASKLVKKWKTLVMKEEIYD